MADTKANESTSLAVFVPINQLAQPVQGTNEALQYRADASAMMEILTMAEVNPKAIACWRGVPTPCGDLVRAWRKATYTAEAKRLHAPK